VTYIDIYAFMNGELTSVTFQDGTSLTLRQDVFSTNKITNINYPGTPLISQFSSNFAYNSLTGITIPANVQL